MKKLIITAILLFSSFCLAVPAYPEPVQFDQGDGVKLTVTLKGDETISWATTADDYTVLKNSKGQFEYAILDEKGDLALSGIVAKDFSKRAITDIDYLNTIPKKLRFSKSQVQIVKQLNQQVYEPNKGLLGTTNGKATKNVILLLAAFADQPFSQSNAATRANFETLMNNLTYPTSNSTGSFKDFHLENSYGNLTFQTTVAGPFTVSRNMVYYGLDSLTSHNIRAKNMVTEVVQLADPTVDFSQFDNDNDGSVDAVYVIYSGYGQEAGGSANTIWAHASSITALTCDTKTVSRYSCSAELRGNSGTNITNIGVICHEFGHVLGAPDYYDTNYETDGQYPGMGYWDVMASGSWNNNGATPAHHNPRTKVYVYNWATATTINSPTNITILNSEENSNAFYRYNTQTPGEFFILENKQQHRFDTSLKGHGLMIYHADSSWIASAGNAINASTHQGFYPMMANHTVSNGVATGTSIDAPIYSDAVPWPGTGNKTTFSDVTTPNSKSWLLGNTRKAITNITENTVDKTINFDFLGGTVPTSDVGIDAISSPVSALNLTVAETITATVKNYGTAAISSGLSLGYKIDGGSAVIEAYTGSAISAGTTVSFTFSTKANLSTYGAHSVEVYTILSGDGYTENNTMTISVTNMEPAPLPFTENFSSSSFPTNWTQQNIGTATTYSWAILNSNYAGGSAYELRAFQPAVSPGTIRFVTPALNTAGCAELRLAFKHFLDAHTSGGTTLNIQSSSDGINWTDESWSMLTTTTDVGPATVNASITHNLGGLTYISWTATGNLYRFVAWYIDDISITQSALSGNKTVGAGGNFTSLTGTGGLFANINASGLSGNTTVNITSDLTESGSIPLNQWSESGTYTLTIQPSDATERTISGSSATNLISLNGADRVTISGNKKLTFSNSNTAGTVLNIDNNATNNTITDCVITGAAAKGINIGNAPGTVISKNRIYNLTGSGTNDVTAIDCNGTNTGSVSIENNMITLNQNTTGTAIVSGINSSGALANLNLYYNSINLTGTQTANSFAFYKNNTTTTCNVKNNLFQNKRTGSDNSYAVGLINVAGTVSQNYNLLYKSTGNLAKYLTTDYADLATWKTNAGQDANSRSGAITFTTSSTGELKFSNIYANNIVYDKGTPVTDITTDFYGSARKYSEVSSGNGEPDIGAYEFAQALGVNDDLIPLTTSLSQNYPNPFNPETAIHFALAKDAQVNLTIYNIKGEVVKSLVNNNYKAGYHSVNFNAMGLNSGVYIYKMTTPEQSFVKKMIMIK